MLAGKVTAIDVEKREITLEDSESKKPVTVLIKNNTILKVFPAEDAQRMARMMAMRNRMMQGGAQGGQMGRPGGQGGGQRPAGGQPGGGNRMGGEGGQQRLSTNVEDMLTRMPDLKLDEIKVGDTIGISSTPTTVSNCFTAIKLISGVEPFLAIPQPAARPEVNHLLLTSWVGRRIRS